MYVAAAIADFTRNSNTQNKRSLDNPNDTRGKGKNAQSITRTAKSNMKSSPTSSSSSAEEATIEWRTNGHEWIGQNVLRVFDDSSIGGSQMATVTGWVAADGSDEALWHVVRACGWASTRACVCAIILLVLFWLYI